MRIPCICSACWFGKAFIAPVTAYAPFSTTIACENASSSHASWASACVQQLGRVAVMRGAEGKTAERPRQEH